MATRNNHYPQTIFWLIVVLLVSVAGNTYFLTTWFERKPSFEDCTIVIENKNGREEIPEDAFMGKVVDFYQTMLGYQFATVGVLLVVGFAFSYYISRKQVREVLDEELYSEHFKEHYLPQLREYGKQTVLDALNDNNTSTNIEELQVEFKNLRGAFVKLQDQVENNENKTSKTNIKKQPRK